MTWKRHLHIVPPVNLDPWHGWESFWAYVLERLDDMQDHLADPVAYCLDGYLCLTGRTTLALGQIVVRGDVDCDEFGDPVPEGA